MELKVTVRKGATSCFTVAQLEDIAASLKVCIPDKMRLVYYGQTAPLDVSLSWQPVDGIGSPVGKVKNYSNGSWNE